jgi:hypothetical protein
MWIGLGSFELALAYVLCILAALLCLFYGLYFWRERGEEETKIQEFDWDKEQQEMEKEVP